jgi:GntR family transcriptional regulator of arabinose operon
MALFVSFYKHPAGCYIVYINWMDAGGSMGVPLYKQIYNYIILQVRKGKWKAGDRIPSEKELAEQFGVSRITAKKALDLLAQEQLIERIQGKGSFISRNDSIHAENKEAKAPKGRLTIGLIIPDFGESYGTGIIRAIEEQCRHYQAHLILKLSRGESEREEQALSGLIEIGADGMIVFPINGEHFNQKILELVVKNYPLVLLDRYFRGIPASSVCTDNRLAAMEAANRLFSLGHERIGFLSCSPEGTSAIEERIQGFHLAYSQRAYPLDAELILTDLHGDLGDRESVEHDIEAVQQFVERHPDVTAFVACEYALAVVLRLALERMGKSIPEDVSVISFDSPPSHMGMPEFTYIRQDEEGIGKAAVELIIKQLHGNHVPQHTFVDFTLVEGRSARHIRSIARS